MGDGDKSKEVKAGGNAAFGDSGQGTALARADLSHAWWLSRGQAISGIINQ